jgi:hypothetical protein
MDDADVLHDLQCWNQMGEPFVPEVSALGEVRQARMDDTRVLEYNCRSGGQ